MRFQKIWAHLSIIKMVGVIAMLCLIIGCATVPSKPTRPIKQEGSFVFELPGKSKNTIFKDVLQWLALNYKDSKVSIDLKDEESGKIIGKGQADYKWTSFVGSALPHKFKYTYIIDVKEEKARITYQDILVSTVKPYVGTMNVTWEPLSDNSTEELVWDEINSFGKDMEKNLLSQQNSDF